LLALDRFPTRRASDLPEIDLHTAVAGRVDCASPEPATVRSVLVDAPPKVGFVELRHYGIPRGGNFTEYTPSLVVQYSSMGTPRADRKSTRLNSSHVAS